MPVTFISNNESYGQLTPALCSISVTALQHCSDNIERTSLSPLFRARQFSTPSTCIVDGVLNLQCSSVKH